jgi:hypothetical protein
MNKDFVIEEQYNHGVGLIEIDETQKLIKHYECKLVQMGSGSRNRDVYTIDIYENGLIKIIRMIINDWDMKIETFPPQEILNMNITNGEKIDEILLELIENIYDPYCKKICVSWSQSMCHCLGPYGHRSEKCSNPRTKSMNIALGNHISTQTSNTLLPLFESTFQQLHTIKKLYNKIVIF